MSVSGPRVGDERDVEKNGWHMMARGKRRMLWTGLTNVTSLKTNMTLETQPFKDVSPVKIGDSTLSC